MKKKQKRAPGTNKTEMVHGCHANHVLFNKLFFYILVHRDYFTNENQTFLFFKTKMQNVLSHKKMQIELCVSLHPLPNILIYQ